MPLFALGDLRPQVDPTAFVAPTAVLIGDVVVGPRASIWFGAVLRGDSGRITIGEGSNVQDNAVLHEETTLGRNVTIAHLVLAHAIVAEDDVLIGNGALAFGGAHIGSGSVIGAGAVLAPGTDVPPGKLALGVPAKVIRDARDSDRALILGTARTYQALRDRYGAEFRAL